MLNSGGGDIKLCVDEVRSFGVEARGSESDFEWLLLTMFEINAGGNGNGDFNGDLGLFNIVA